MKRYCTSLTSYERRRTIDVHIGALGMGSNFPIRVQSMTTTNTMDTDATIAQSIRMIDAGCELVRITAPSIREAKNLELIKKGLRERGYDAPLVADIHYTPNAAEIAARFVEKVRVNPGNYVDKKQFAVLEYTDDEYRRELDRIRERFTPLVRICKEHGTAMRIGTNHGSLSDRIMSRYGDSPEGMVESALEFLHIAHDEGFDNLVLSMKSSNPIIMIQAYRLLVARLNEAGLPPYPLHLGVTEAGDGEDGRVKSALGIGTLLEDGLGDTIRVSLTEEPEAEIPVARALAERYTDRAADAQHIPPMTDEAAHDPFHYHRRATRAVANIGHDHVPRVIADASLHKITEHAELAAFGHTYDAVTDKWSMSDQAADYIYTGARPIPFMVPNGTRQIVDHATWLTLDERFYTVPLHSLDAYLQGAERHTVMNVVLADVDHITPEIIATLHTDTTCVLALSSTNAHWYPSVRRVLYLLEEHRAQMPVVLWRTIQETDAERFTLYASTDLGGLLADGFGDAVFLRGDQRLSFGILQAARTRMTKTEYISCPSCGRTLFDLQETTAMIRRHTEHLKGVKIGIMGCIVNGPGEMADADYGYVGSGPDRITLYRGQEIVRRNVPTAEAVDALIAIIKEDDRWRSVEA
jgi:(E)-4-hydroxy-3-methylbut-2-enyl-diphosphate synthase